MHIVFFTGPLLLSLFQVEFPYRWVALFTDHAHAVKFTSWILFKVLWFLKYTYCAPFFWQNRLFIHWVRDYVLLPLIFYRIHMYKLVIYHLTGTIMQEMVGGQGFKSQPSQACIFSQVLRGTYREFNVYNVYWVGQNPNLYSLE